MAATSSSFSK
ncbi:hypothetical protein Tco_0587215, partial [Tanacetum coccineum]